MNLNHSPVEVLDMLAGNEEAVGRLYRIYAEKFPEALDLWVELADEENSHAASIMLLKKDVLDRKLHLQPGRFKGAAIQTYHKYLEGEIAAAQKGTNLIYALSVAMSIEDSLIERKFFEIFTTDAPEMQHVLHDLEEATRRHSRRIREFRAQHKST
jgi:rubrerythrin